jgi:hypothetical protein
LSGLPPLPSLFWAIVAPFSMGVTIPVSPSPFHITPVPLVIVVLTFLFLLSPFTVPVRWRQWRRSCHPHPCGRWHGSCRHPWSPPLSRGSLVLAVVLRFHCSCRCSCRPILCGRAPLVVVVSASSVCIVVGLVIGIGVLLLVLFVRHC